MGSGDSLRSYSTSGSDTRNELTLGRYEPFLELTTALALEALNHPEHPKEWVNRLKDVLTVM